MKAGNSAIPKLADGVLYAPEHAVTDTVVDLAGAVLALFLEHDSAVSFFGDGYGGFVVPHPAERVIPLVRSLVVSDGAVQSFDVSLQAGELLLGPVDAVLYPAVVLFKGEVFGTGAHTIEETPFAGVPVLGQFAVGELLDGPTDLAGTAMGGSLRMSHIQMLIRHHPDYKPKKYLVPPQRPLEMSLFVNCATSGKRLSEELDCPSRP